MTTRDPADMVPLRPVVFGILLALNEGDLHGYGIMQKVNDRMGKRVLVGPGTLYRTLTELRDEGLIEPVESGPDEEDSRRRYYALTAFGDAVARAEAARLDSLTAMARKGGLLA